MIKFFKKNELKILEKKLAIKQAEVKKSYINNFDKFNFISYDYYKETITPKLAYEYFNNVAPIYNAVNIKAIAVGDLDVSVVNVEGDIISDKASNDILLKLKNPSEDTTYSEFMYRVSKNDDLSGEVFFLIKAKNENSEPRIIEVIPSDLMQCEKRGVNIAYRYNRVDKEQITFLPQIKSSKIRYFAVNLKVKNEVWELVHKKSHNITNDGLRGVSKLSSIQPEIQGYMQATNYNNSLLKNQARPSGILKFNSNMAIDGRMPMLGDDQFLKLKKDIAEQYQGTYNAGKPLLLEGGLEYQQTAINQKDMEFLEGINRIERVIYNSLGIPLPLITNEASTQNNKKQAILDLYNFNIIPYMSNLLEELSKILIPRYTDKPLTFSINENTIPAIREEKSEEIERKSKSNIYTMNELRAMAGLDAIAGGDDVFTQSGIPITSNGITSQDVSVADTELEEIENNN